MTAKISHVKASKILHHYFGGMPQLKTAQKCGVNQATVCRCAAKFEKEAADKGILEAAKEYGIMNEVTALRSLATELYKSKASVEEAKSGIKMVALFNSLDVPPEEYKVLAKMFKKLKEPDFHKTGMKLVKLEESTGKDYTDVISEFEQLGAEIAGRQETIATLKEKQDKEEKSLEELELVRKQKEVELTEFLKEADQKKAAADAGVNQKLGEAGLTIEKIAKLHPVVEKLEGLGISDDKLETLVGEQQVLEEYGITWEKFQTVAEALAKAGEINGDGLAVKLEEYGTLDQAITSMEAEKTSLQPEVEKLGEDKVKLAAEVDGLVKSKAQLETEISHLNGSKKALEDTIDTLKVRRAHLEKHLAVLENDVAELIAEKAALTEEAGQKCQEVTKMNEKLKEADAIDQAIKEKQMESQELDAKNAAAKQNFQLYEAFLGLVGERSGAEIEEFLKFAPTLVSESKEGNYDPSLLVNVILSELSGNTLDHLICQVCKAEFVMLKRGQKAMAVAHLAGDVPKWCPDCSEVVKVEVKTPLAENLKKVIISNNIILVKEPGKTAPVEKDCPKDQGN